MSSIPTDTTLWSVGLCLSVTTVNPAKMAEPIQMPFWMWIRAGPRNHVLDGAPNPHTWRGNFEGEKGPAHDMPGHFQQSIYSKWLSRGQKLYRTYENSGVLDAVDINAVWQIRLNRPSAAAMQPYVKLLSPLVNIRLHHSTTLWVKKRVPP